jgi:hypothetical protein
VLAISSANVDRSQIWAETKEREHMPRTLILIAYSSNFGGGRSGLLSLLANLQRRADARH